MIVNSTSPEAVNLMDDKPVGKFKISKSTLVKLASAC